MALTNFDIEHLYKESFGTRGSAFNTPEKTVISQTKAIPIPIAPGENISGLDIDASLRYFNPIGRPLFMPMRIGELQLPNEPIVTINVSKKIVQTPLIGSKKQGGVIELVHTDNYKINIKGIAVNFAHKGYYPKDIVDAIHKLFKEDKNQTIASPLTNLLGIERVVLTSLKFPPLTGTQHAQAFEISCVSDSDFILELEA